MTNPISVLRNGADSCVQATRRELPNKLKSRDIYRPAVTKLSLRHTGRISFGFFIRSRRQSTWGPSAMLIHEPQSVGYPANMSRRLPSRPISSANCSSGAGDA